MTQHGLHDRVRRFEKRCEVVITDVRKVLSWIRRKRDQAGWDDEEPEWAEHVETWWNDIFTEVERIFNAEINLLWDLKAWLGRRREDKTVAQRDLEICKHIVRDMDLPAKLAKMEVGDPWLRPPGDPGIKASLRDMVYQHWKLRRQLMEGVKGQHWPDDVVGYTEKCCESLAPELEKLKWLRGIFICYKREEEEDEDRKVLLEFTKRVEGTLRDEHYISLWYDQHEGEGFGWGDDWLNDLTFEIRNRDVAIVLVSKASLASEFIKEHEVPELRRRRQEEGLRICPLILEECNWQDEDWLAATQYWPPDGKTVSADYQSPEARDRLYVQLMRELVTIMGELSTVDYSPRGPGRTYERGKTRKLRDLGRRGSSED